MTQHDSIPEFLMQHLLQFIQTLPSTTCYWVAFSGGMDSTCLLHAIAQLRQHISTTIRALHVNHGIHKESTIWALHCQKICDELGIECKIQTLAIQAIRGESLESLARYARLAAYQAIIGVDDVVITAQHQDDQTETMLLQLLRGSGLPGLAAMPKLSALPPGWLARPLLDISHSQLLDYARKYNLTWVEDPSNMHEVFDRNYLRHSVMPLIAKRWPAYNLTVTRSTKHCAEAQALLNDLLMPIMQTVQGQRVGTLSQLALLKLEPKLCRAVLRRWIQNHGQIVPHTKIIQQIQEKVLTAAKDRSPQVNWAAMEIRRYRDDIFLISRLPPLPKKCIEWPIQNEYCDLPSGLGRLKRCHVFSMQNNNEIWNNAVMKVCFGIVGVRCQPVDSRHHSSLKKIYQSRAIPDWCRPYIPLVYLNDELIAVAGVCQCVALESTMEWEIVWDAAPRWIAISCGC